MSVCRVHISSMVKHRGRTLLTKETLYPSTPVLPILAPVVAKLFPLGVGSFTDPESVLEKILSLETPKSLSLKSLINHLSNHCFSHA